MDKYNIIVPTGDLVELNIDMANWCNLPFDMRMRSNDECIRKYGCTVIDFYNKIKTSILRGEDYRNTDNNNIVIGESTLKEKYDNFGDLLEKSKNLQENPYIVIIDPDINNMEDLNDRYESFAMLNDKNKRLSNDFSWQLWGYNVPNMYEVLKDEINTEDPEHSNIRFESATYKMESCILPLRDYYTRAVLSGDILRAAMIKNNIDSMSGVLESSIAVCNNITEPDHFDYTILPKVSPWLTAHECIRYSPVIRIDPNTYYQDLRESVNKANFNDPKVQYKILSQGWIDSIKVDESSLEFARKRQASYIENYMYIVDARNIVTEEEFSRPEKLSVYPLFFVLGYPETFTQFANLAHYNKAGISFDLSLSKVYTFDGVGDSFTGFKPESVSNYGYIDVVAIFVDEEAYNTIKDNCINTVSGSVSNFGFGSVYSILTKTKNELSPDNMKLIYSQYIDLLLKVASIDITNHTISYNNFALNKSTTVFKVYSGFSKDYTKETVDKIYNILCIIQDNTTRANFIREYTNITDEDVIEDLTNKLAPVNSIYKK